MWEQLFQALVTIVIGVGACILYFWGSNWLLDRLISARTADGVATAAQDKLRTRIRPWLFLFPALFFMGVYLVYPVFETVRLSFFDRGGTSFVGLNNYGWA